LDISKKGKGKREGLAMSFISPFNERKGGRNG